MKTAACLEVRGGFFTRSFKWVLTGTRQTAQYTTLPHISRGHVIARIEKQFERSPGLRQRSGKARNIKHQNSNAG